MICYTKKQSCLLLLCGLYLGTGLSWGHADALRQDISAIRIQAKSRHIDQGVVRLSGRPVAEVGGRFLWQRLAFDWEWLTGIGASYDESLFGGAYVLNARDAFLAPVLLQVGGRRRGYMGEAERESRWEAWGRLDWLVTRFLGLEVEGYHGVNRARTGFGTIGLYFPLDTGRGIVVTPRVALGLDFGDVSGRRRLQENNTEFAVEFSAPLSQLLSYTAEVRHSDGVGDRETGARVPARTLASIGLVATF